MSENVMIDLETLGLKYGSVILSIGAVKFSTDVVLPQTSSELKKNAYLCTLPVNSSMKEGFVIDSNTLGWWMKQSKEAQLNSFNFEDTNDPDILRDGLENFAKWIKPGSLIWCNGANFDNILLEAYFEKLEIPCPWKFYNVKCFRTVKTLLPFNEEIIERNTSGTKHTALDDAIHQAQTLQAIAIRNKENVKWK